MNHKPEKSAGFGMMTSAAQLSRPGEQVMLEGELREASIRINPEIGAVLSLNEVRGNLISSLKS